MKIGLVASALLPVPPQKYGGTERVVAMLADGLVAAGHEVMLFASGDSKTQAELVPTWPTALSTGPQTDLMRRFTYANSVILGQVVERAKGLDLIHSHIDENALILSKLGHWPLITTIHSKLEASYQELSYRYYQNAYYVALSENQRQSMPNIHWWSTVHNGVPLDDFKYSDKPDDYLLFIGRISPEKGPAAAIKIAEATGQRLIIAAKVDVLDQTYFKAEIEPLLKRYPKAEFIGETTNLADKVKLYRGAKAMLFPIDWPEPFGLVLIEALACGTPVIARRRGSVPEIIEDGVTGFIGETDDDLIKAVNRIDEIDRQNCRIQAEKFSSQKMVENYIRVYREVLADYGGAS